MAARPSNLLDMIPVRNRDWTDDHAGRVQVLVPRYGRWRVGRWLADRLGRPHIVVRLDEVGSAVWRACDGSADVGRIASRLGDRFGDTVTPVHERLSRYFREMERGRLIRWRA